MVWKCFAEAKPVPSLSILDVTLYFDILGADLESTQSRTKVSPPSPGFRGVQSYSLWTESSHVRGPSSWFSVEVSTFVYPSRHSQASLFEECARTVDYHTSTVSPYATPTIGRACMAPSPGNKAMRAGGIGKQFLVESSSGTSS